MSKKSRKNNFNFNSHKRKKSTIPSKKDFSKYRELYKTLKEKEEDLKRMKALQQLGSRATMLKQKGSATFLKMFSDLGYIDYIYTRESAWEDFLDFAKDEIMSRANRRLDRGERDYEMILDMYNWDFDIIGDMMLGGHGKNETREIVREFINRSLNMGVLLPPQDDDEQTVRDSIQDTLDNIQQVKDKANLPQENIISESEIGSEELASDLVELEELTELLI